MMASTADLAAIIEAHSLSVLFPLAVIEGPIVTVVAGWLSHLGYLPLARVACILVLADLVGDALLYWLGRSGLALLSDRWRARLGLLPDRVSRLVAHFRDRGGLTLLLAKLTHSLGFAALVAAGAARMPLLPFFGFNLLGTLPKTALLLLLGSLFGAANVAIGTWIGRGTIVMGIALTVLVIAWLTRHRWRRS